MGTGAVAGPAPGGHDMKKLDPQLEAARTAIYRSSVPVSLGLLAGMVAGGLLGLFTSQVALCTGAGASLGLCIGAALGQGARK